MSYYVHRGGHTLGPYSPDNIINMLRAHQLAVEDLAVQEGCEDWQPLGNIVDPNVLVPGAPKNADMSAMGEDGERVFYACKGVSVTLSRFIIGSQTFAMRNISSVKLRRIEPSRFAAGLGLLIGLICLINEGSRIFGFVLATLMLVILFRQKPRYAIILTASSGEVKALVDQDRAWISKIVNALNESMVARA